MKSNGGNMKIIQVKDYNEMSAMAAQIIADQIKKKPDTVLGCATGSSPIGTYAALVQMYKDSQADFSRVSTFNLDEYCGLPGTHPQSYRYEMAANLFNHINIKPENINSLDGMAADAESECRRYEKLIGDAGIDLQILGIGLNGHIAFNEPDDVFHGNTRRVKLEQSSIDYNSRWFDDPKDVPTAALTMGMDTIMSARKIILLIMANKLEIFAKLMKSDIDPKLPASILHKHANCTVIVANS